MEKKKMAGLCVSYDAIWLNIKRVERPDDLDVDWYNLVILTEEDLRELRDLIDRALEIEAGDEIDEIVVVKKEGDEIVVKKKKDEN